MKSRTENARALALATLAVLVLGGAVSGCKKKGTDAAADAGPEGGLAEGGADGGRASADAPEDPEPAPAPKPLTGVTVFATKFFSGEVWQGAYVCGKGVVGHSSLELQIVRGSPAVEAIFHFSTPKREAGAFKMSGTYEQGSRHLKLVAKDWITHPPGTTNVGLDGAMSADGRTYAGKVIGPNCRTFGVTRLAR